MAVKEESRVIKLEYAIPVPQGEGKEPIMTNQITLGRLKTKHLKLIPSEVMNGEGDMAIPAAVSMIAGMSGLPESSIDEIDAKDIQEVIKVLVDFLKEFLQDGEIKSME